MKKLIFVFTLLLLTACATPNKYSDFDYSYARSGGLSPIYENLLIKGHKAHYSFEGQNQKIKKDFRITSQELREIENVLEDNNFRMIQEDYKKLYDHISTSISIKKGNNSGRKSDASYIMPKDKERWDKIVMVFQDIITEHVKADSKK